MSRYLKYMQIKQYKKTDPYIMDQIIGELLKLGYKKRKMSNGCTRIRVDALEWVFDWRMGHQIFIVKKKKL